MSKLQRQLTVWSDCSGFRLAPLIKKSLDRLQRRCNGGYKTYSTYILNLSNPLIGLPVETILLIASFLSPASKLLLSLTSKRIRVILTNNLDLTLMDQDQKLEFLQLLEIDLPEYLTCRACVWMFKWQSRKQMSYSCPRSDTYRRYDSHHALRNRVCFFHHTYVRREMIDLILRAHCRGPSHGLPASSIDHECNEKRSSSALSVRQKLEGRIINGQYVLARSCVFVGELSDYRCYMLYPITDFLCAHNTLWASYRTAFAAKAYWDRRQTWDIGTIRCEFCATDMRTRLVPWHVDGMIRVEVDIWQNYGDYWSYKQATPDELRMQNAKLNNSDVAWRNLERDFADSKV